MFDSEFLPGFILAVDRHFGYADRLQISGKCRRFQKLVCPRVQLALRQHCRFERVGILSLGAGQLPCRDNPRNVHPGIQFIQEILAVQLLFRILDPLKRAFRLSAVFQNLIAVLQLFSGKFTHKLLHIRLFHLFRELALQLVKSAAEVLQFGGRLLQISLGSFKFAVVIAGHMLRNISLRILDKYSGCGRIRGSRKLLRRTDGTVQRILHIAENILQPFILFGLLFIRGIRVLQLICTVGKPGLKRFKYISLAGLFFLRELSSAEEIPLDIVLGKMCGNLYGRRYSFRHFVIPPFFGIRIRRQYSDRSSYRTFLSFVLYARIIHLIVQQMSNESEKNHTFSDSVLYCKAAAR